MYIFLWVLFLSTVNTPKYNVLMSQSFFWLSRPLPPFESIGIRFVCVFSARSNGILLDEILQKKKEKKKRQEGVFRHSHFYDIV